LLLLFDVLLLDTFELLLLPLDPVCASLLWWCVRLSSVNRSSLLSAVEASDLRHENTMPPTSSASPPPSLDITAPLSPPALLVIVGYLLSRLFLTLLQ
jgi:hypothetical protein